MRDNWTAIQFDMAVVYFGVYIENKLNETDEKGHRVNDLITLLGTLEERQQASFESIKSMLGGV